MFNLGIYKNKKVKIYFFILITLSHLFFSNCNKEDTSFPDAVDTNYTSDIFGVVTKSTNIGVEGALVSFNGKTAVTNKDGIYLLNSVEVNSKHNMLEVVKEGYFSHFKVFASGQPAIIYQKVNLERAITKEKEIVNSVGANIKTSTSNGRDYMIKIPVNGLAFDSGENYKGYSYDIKYDRINIEQYNFSYSHTYPGSFVGIDANEDQIKLNPFGILFFDIEMRGGPKLKVANGKVITLTLQIQPNHVNIAPNTITLWNFDFKTGYWKAWGKANRNGNEYVGNVNNVGYWMFSEGVPAIIVSGRMKDEDKNLISSPSEIVNKADLWSFGPQSLSNYDGSFSLWVEKNKQFHLNLWPVNINHQESIIGNAQTRDFSLGDIFVKTILSTPVSGFVKDCNGEPLKRGYLIKNPDFDINKFIPVINGMFKDYVPSDIAGTTYTYIAVDLDNNIEGQPQTFKISQFKDDLHLQACQ